MKKLIALVVLLALAGWFVESVHAQQWRQLTQQEQTRTGASHVWTIEAADLTETTDDTAQTLAISVGAKRGVTFVAAVLAAPFATAGTNDSVTLEVRDTDTAGLYLAATQVASSGSVTPVYLSFPRQTTPAITLQRATVDGNENVVTNVVLAVTEYGRRLYTADKQLRAVFTPANTTKLSNYTTGEVRLYFHLWDAR